MTGHDGIDQAPLDYVFCRLMTRLIEVVRIRKAVRLAPLLLVAACAGDGVRDPQAISEKLGAGDGNTACASRNTGFGGSAVRIFMFRDGEQILAIGNNEVASFQAPPGEYQLTLKFEGPADQTTTSNTITYKNDPWLPQYFTISQKAEFIGAKLILSEVTESSFSASR